MQIPIVIDGSCLVRMLAFNNAVMIACRNQIIGFVNRRRVYYSDRFINVIGPYWARQFIFGRNYFIQCRHMWQNLTYQRQNVYGATRIAIGQYGNMAKSNRQQCMKHAGCFVLENLQHRFRFLWLALVRPFRRAARRIIAIHFGHSVRPCHFRVLGQILWMNLRCADLDLVLKWICEPFVQFQRLHDALGKGFDAFCDVTR